MEGAASGASGGSGVEETERGQIEMAADKILQVRNRKTGVISPMKQSQWNKIKDTPQWKGVFSVSETPEPKEVKELRKRKESAAAKAAASESDTKED